MYIVVKYDFLDDVIMWSAFICEELIWCFIVLCSNKLIYYVFIFLIMCCCVYNSTY